MQVLLGFPSPQWMRCLDLLRQSRVYYMMYTNLQVRSGAYCTGLSSNLLTMESLASNLLPGRESLPRNSSHLLLIVGSTYMSECLRNIFHMLSVRLHWSFDLQLVYQGKDLGQSSRLKKSMRYVSYY
jgi:hypothetical protein